MGYINCCGYLQKSKTFTAEPKAEFLACRVDYLAACLHCGHAVIQITRVSEDGKVSIIRKVGVKAVNFLQKNKFKLKKLQSYSNPLLDTRKTFYGQTKSKEENPDHHSASSTLKTTIKQNKHLHLNCNYLIK